MTSQPTAVAVDNAVATSPIAMAVTSLLSVFDWFAERRRIIQTDRSRTGKKANERRRKDRPSTVFYRAMHFSAKRGIAIACRLSVRPSVCLSVCLSVTLVNYDHIGCNSSKIISPLVSLGRSLFATPTRRVCSKGNTPKFSPE